MVNMEAAVVEAGGSSDSSSQQLQDIQSYLATFNKEIGDGSTITTIPTNQQLFVQNQGQSNETVQQILNSAEGIPTFIQTNQDIQNGTLLAQNAVDGTQTSVTVPFMSSASGFQNLPIHVIGNDDNQTQIIQSMGASNQVVMDTNETTGAEEDDNKESVMLKTGNSYQTVTIVPTSEVNQSGEVSYVLIVSQPDDKGADMSVFDFKEEKHSPEQLGEDVMEEDMTGAGEPKKSVTHFKYASARRAPITQLMCNYCNYTSTKRYLLTRHMKTHSEERPHKCNICDRGFKTIASLQNHINTHTGVKPHGCKECDASFTTSGELVRHVRYRHTFEKPHKCPDCDYASVELSKLKRHIRSHTGERPYQCPHCPYASPDTYKLKRHLRIHTGEKPYECDICHARFTQSNSLKAHRLIHSGEKPIFQCELCPTTCGRKTDLKIHVQKLHTSDKPIPCKKCGKSFPDRYTYKMHMKTHDGEKCFRCELCPYAAMSQRHLESHILTHTGEKPFKCDQCDMAFRQKQLLRRHKNLYHTPNYTPPPPKLKAHQCVECGKTFAHRGNMLRHMAMHDPDNPMYQEINIMKVEAEEARQLAQQTMEEMDEEDDCEDGQEQHESYMESAPREVQVQLVDENGDHTEQIYFQLENPHEAIEDGNNVTEEEAEAQFTTQLNPVIKVSVNDPQFTSQLHENTILKVTNSCNLEKLSVVESVGGMVVGGRVPKDNKAQVVVRIRENIEGDSCVQQRNLNEVLVKSEPSE